MTGFLLRLGTLVVFCGLPVLLLASTPTGKKELCRATYRAEQTGDKVTLRAAGEHPTGGFTQKFERAAIDIFPPQFILYHWKPEGVVTQVITPFVTQDSFKSKEKLDKLVVQDADGSHDVPVVQS